MAKSDPLKEERYTPEPFVIPVREVLGEIDLDPASCQEANKIVQAKKYYTKEDNGLALPWDDCRVFVNPPYSRMLPWVDKLLEELLLENTKQLILLANAATDTKWFRKLVTFEFIEPQFCFVYGRIKFISPSNTVNTDTIKKPNRPEKPSMFVHFGDCADQLKFLSVFSKIGSVMRYAS